MLRNKDTQISNIAYESGFTSVPYFNRIFKRKYGCTPKEYRSVLLHYENFFLFRKNGAILPQFVPSDMLGDAATLGGGTDSGKHVLYRVTRYLLSYAQKPCPDGEQSSSEVGRLERKNNIDRRYQSGVDERLKLPNMYRKTGNIK